ncbi:MAG: transposase family protein, partial [Nostoc sp. LLA-1]|nr:transposase family protein [Cyanocohniella sp. LLY]
PHKKKRKQQLNEQQKSENKALSSKQIFVEHLIRVVKIFQVASQRFRLNADVYNEIVLLVLGLHEEYPDVVFTAIEDFLLSS